MEPSTVVLTVVVAVVVVALVVALGKMSSDVRRLSAQLADVRRDAEEQRRAARDERERAEREHDRAALLRADHEVRADQEPAPDDDVPLITGIGADDVPDQVRTTRVVSAAFGEPVIKAASLAHGIRHALDDEGRLRVRAAVRKEMKRQRKVRRRARRRPSPEAGSQVTGRDRATPERDRPWNGEWAG